jgi:hypothetical protein
VQFLNVVGAERGVVLVREPIAAPGSGKLLCDDSGEQRSDGGAGQVIFGKGADQRIDVFQADGRWRELVKCPGALQVEIQSTLPTRSASSLARSTSETLS